MRYGNSARNCAGSWAIGLCAACILFSSAYGVDDYEVVEVPLDIAQVGGAIDVTFSGADEVFVLRPSQNAMTKVVYDDLSIAYTVWSDDYAQREVLFNVLCSQRPPGLQTFCWECPANGGSLIYAPMTDGVSLDYAAGTLVVGRADWVLGLYTTEMELWYVCGAPVGDGQPEDISEYNMTFGSTGTFSLQFPENGVQPVNGMVVGGINPGTKFLSSRKGSGTGGGGPYPGVDSGWQSGQVANSLSASPAAADFNGDGWEDLVVLHPSDNLASFLPFESLSTPTDGDGNPVPGGAVFGTPITFTPSVVTPQFVSAGDFDNDSLIDVVIVGEAGDLEIRIGDGSGAFAAGGFNMILPGVPTSIEAADLDDDGDAEVLAGGGYSDGGGWLVLAWIDNNTLESQLFEFDGMVEALAVNEFGGDVNVALTRKTVTETYQEIFWWVPGQDVYQVPGDLGEVITADGGWSTLTVGQADGSVRTFDTQGATTCSIPPSGERLPVAVGGGDYFTVVAYDDGTIDGCSWFSQLPTPPGDLGAVVDIDAGQSHVVALQADGTVRCWGNNADGQCDVPDGLVNVVSVAAGGDHTVALRSDGVVECWGIDWGGQSSPPPGLTDVVQIDATFADTIALRSDGTVACWGGYNATSKPPGLSGVVQVAAGDLYNTVLLEDGSLECYGASWGLDGDCAVPEGLGIVNQIVGNLFGYSTIAITTVPVYENTATLLKISLLSGIPGDINNDGQVNGADLGLLLAAWGVCVDPANCPGDFNEDGQINGSDLGTLLAYWTG